MATSVSLRSIQIGPPSSPGLARRIGSRSDPRPERARIARAAIETEPETRRSSSTRRRGRRRQQSASVHDDDVEALDPGGEQARRGWGNQRSPDRKECSRRANIPNVQAKAAASILGGGGDGGQALTVMPSFVARRAELTCPPGLAGRRPA